MKARVLILMTAAVAAGASAVAQTPPRAGAGDIIRLLLDRSVSVRDTALLMAQSDTELMRQESVYAIRPYGLLERDDRRNAYIPYTGADGSDFHQRIAAAGVTKLFTSGTGLGLSATDNRFQFATLNQNPMLPSFHRGDLTLSISQDLLRNGFGYNSRRQYDIATQNINARRESFADQISRSVATSLVGFWNLALASENVAIATMQRDDSKRIRALVQQRVQIGLSEDYENYQWNSIVLSAEGQLRAVQTDREKQRIDLLRLLKLESGFETPDSVILFDTMPEDVDQEKDTQLALERRLDLRSLRRLAANARTAVEITENNLMPSVTFNGRYNSRDWGQRTRQAFGDIGLYPESSVQLRVDLPMWDEGVKVDARNARIEMERLRLQEELLTQQVRDDMKKAILDLRSTFQVLSEAKNSMTQAQAYYDRAIMRFQQGRAQTFILVQALNALVNAKSNLIGAKVAFNVARIQYDLAKNYLFERYGIDPEKPIEGGQ